MCEVSGPRARCWRSLGAVAHAIRLGECSTVSTNVAIPTMRMRGAIQGRGNCMRHSWKARPAGAMCPVTQLIREMRTAGAGVPLVGTRGFLGATGNNKRPRRQSRALFLRPMGVGCVRQIARATLSDFRHLVHTFRRLGVPLTRARTRWMFGFHRRLVRTCECDTLLPKPGPLPHTSQTAATMFSSVCLPVQSLAPRGRGETHPSVLEPKATMTE